MVQNKKNIKNTIGCVKAGFLDRNFLATFSAIISLTLLRFRWTFFCFVGIEMVYQIIDTRNVLNQPPFYIIRFAMVYPLTAGKGHLYFWANLGVEPITNIWLLWFYFIAEGTRCIESYELWITSFGLFIILTSKIFFPQIYNIVAWRCLQILIIQVIM